MKKYCSHCQKIRHNNTNRPLSVSKHKVGTAVSLYWSPLQRAKCMCSAVRTVANVDYHACWVFLTITITFIVAKSTLYQTHTNQPYAERQYASNKIGSIVLNAVYSWGKERIGAGWGWRVGEWPNNRHMFAGFLCSVYAFRAGNFLVAFSLLFQSLSRETMSVWFTFLSRKMKRSSFISISSKGKNLWEMINFCSLISLDGFHDAQCQARIKQISVG